eukprot:CAMPEP_0181137992 /NCGR_PEP_ID=MMETSP1071-20121207/34004_1 /TAXON_ID=35127 /ORGANISM="Thalassiosira sp., Strain NH16" /LENGTH=76 /DNA_ID=CAMNT_0023224789 /DNA_START=228 /DNA_END=458 /DNA_ORIENTATION=-
MRAHMPVTLDLDQFLFLLPNIEARGTIDTHVLIALLELIFGSRADVAVRARVTFLWNQANSARISIAISLQGDVFA